MSKMSLINTSSTPAIMNDDERSNSSITSNILNMEDDYNYNVTYPDCQDICNITVPSWCRNFIDGLKTSHCPHDECFSMLCRRALDCQQKLFTEIQKGVHKLQGYCPLDFDGWSCIDSVKGGTVATTSCPDFDHYNFHIKNLALRKCSDEGVWFDSVEQKTHTDYTGCPDEETFKWYNSINTIYVVGYSISLLFLFLSIFVFFYFRSLYCVRNTIHTNLFIACTLHNISWIIWFYAVQQRMGDISNWTPPAIVMCKILNTSFNYFMVCTYFWMLCEGWYLFIVLIVTFISESRILLVLRTLGWIFPAILILLYSILRSTSNPGQDLNFSETQRNATLMNSHLNVPPHEYCWMFDSPYSWTFKAPCILSVILNLVFLAIIVFILVSKLHSDLSDHAALVKTSKAIGVLVPLFGLHNLLASFKPDDVSSRWRIVIELISAITISFQGMIVSILFCFMNSEVLFQLKRFFGDQLDSTRAHHQSLAMTQYTYVRPANNSNVSPKLMRGKAKETFEEEDERSSFV